MKCSEVCEVLSNRVSSIIRRYTDHMKFVVSFIFFWFYFVSFYIWLYEGNSISKLQIVIEKNRMEIMTYKQHLFFNIISIQI